MKSMTFQEYAEQQDWVPGHMVSMYVDMGGVDYEQVYEAIIDEATKENTILTDADTVDFGAFLHDWFVETK